MIESVAVSYRESLSAIERKIYDMLPGVEQDAFRILRDLALWSEPKRGSFEFFMSCKQLWVPGEKPQASIFRWLLN